MSLHVCTCLESVIVLCHRQKVFSLDYSKLDKAVDNIHSEMRTWSPDRTTIEKYLNITRKNGSRHQKHSANSQ